MFSEEGSFWGSAIVGSPIDSILSQMEFSLEEILDENMAIQETKNQNEKLVEYLQEPTTISLLLDYVGCTSHEMFMELFNRSIFHSKSASSGDETTENELTDPAALTVGDDAIDDDDVSSMELVNEERAMKFPFVACEMLSCNLTPVIESMVNSPDLLDKFFSLLQVQTLDSRLSGYFYKILSVLIRRAPEKILWFSIYRNVNISVEGCKGGIEGIGWLIPLFLRHIDSYSIMCCFKSLLRIAADEGSMFDDGDEDIDDQNDFGNYGQAEMREPMGDLDGHGDGQDETRNRLLRIVRSVWLGGSGTALAVLDSLAASSNSDSHVNAAELLVDMIQRSAMARLSLQEDDHIAEEGENSDDVLPTFKGLILSSPGQGASAASAMMESGCEWMLQLCGELVKVALFKQDDDDVVVVDPPRTDETDDIVRIVELGSAAVASLQVLTHLVSSFALERWSQPGEAMIRQGLSHITTVERHETTPGEIKLILARLDEFVMCLKHSYHANLFQISETRANKYLGMHRLKVAELICMLVHTKYPQVIETIAGLDPNPLSVCLDLFFEFRWNNCLHSVLERTIQFIFLGGVSEESIGFNSEDDDDPHGHHRYDRDDDDEDKDEEALQKELELRQDEFSREQRTANRILLPLQLCLFSKCDLVNRLLRAYNANTRLENGELSFGEFGYMGFCNRIVNTIVLVAASQRNERERSREKEEEQEQDSERYSALNATETNDEWIGFVQRDLMKINAIEQCVLGGTRPQPAHQPPSETMDELDPSDADLDDFPSNFDSFGITSSELQYPQHTDEDSNSSDDEFDSLAAQSADDPSDLLAERIQEKLSIGEGEEGDDIQQNAMWVPDFDDDDDDNGFDHSANEKNPPTPPPATVPAAAEEESEEWSPFG